jgi:hypothetical protein
MQRRDVERGLDHSDYHTFVRYCPSLFSATLTTPAERLLASSGGSSPSTSSSTQEVAIPPGCSGSGVRKCLASQRCVRGRCFPYSQLWRVLAKDLRTRPKNVTGIRASIHTSDGMISDIRQTRGCEMHCRAILRAQARVARIALTRLLTASRAQYCDLPTMTPYGLINHFVVNARATRSGFWTRISSRNCPRLEISFALKRLAWVSLLAAAGSMFEGAQELQSAQLTVSLGHAATVTSVAFSADDRLR